MEERELCNAHFVVLLNVRTVSNKRGTNRNFLSTFINLVCVLFSSD